MKTMNLIEAYVYEVTNRLPEKMRDDIALELRSTIEDMLPDDYSEEEVISVLTKLGDPAQLAASYRDSPTYLIGPKVYDVYIWTMKMIIPWVIIITFLVHVIESIVVFSGEESVLSVMINSIGIIIVKVISALIHTFFWVTIVFIVIERVGLSKDHKPLTKFGKQWTPEQLKYVHIIPRKKAISKGEIIFGFIWTAIWVIFYLNADHLAGIYRTIDGELQMVMPAFNQAILMSYLPIVLLLALLEIGIGLYKWKERQWTIKLVTVNAVIKIFSVIVFIIIVTQPSLINEAVIPYLADVIEIERSSVGTFIQWAIGIAVVAVIASIIYEVYDIFRKARI